MADSLPPERSMPASLDAERAVLGAILINDGLLNDVAAVVKPAQFYRDAHRRIFGHMLALATRGVAIDYVTLRDELVRAGELDEIGGPMYVTALTDGIPKSTNAAYYASIVLEKALLRDVIYAANTALKAAYETEDEASAIIATAEAAFFAIGDRARRGGFRSSRELLPALMEKLEQLQKERQAVTGVPSGYADLDDYTLGFQPGDLILIAGRPGHGKTSFAVNVADHVSGQSDLTTGVFSLEMSSAELMMRRLAANARVDSHRIRSGYLGAQDWGRISLALSQLDSPKLFIDDSPNLTVFEMRARARRLKAEHDLRLLVVDYLQLTSSQAERKTENRALEVAAMSRALKGLAREMMIPIIVLSQLNRGPEGRTDHRPQLGDLRESGALEQDADMVVFVYRPDLYADEGDQKDGIAELIIAKQRNGPTGTVKLAYISEYTRFENLAISDTPPADRRLPMSER